VLRSKLAFVKNKKQAFIVSGMGVKVVEEAQEGERKRSLNK